MDFTCLAKCKKSQSVHFSFLMGFANNNKLETVFPVFSFPFSLFYYEHEVQHYESYDFVKKCQYAVLKVSHVKFSNMLCIFEYQNKEVYIHDFPNIQQNVTREIKFILIQ